MPTPLDIAVAFLFAGLVPLASALFFDKRFRGQVAAGFPRARRNAYRRSLILQWILAVAVILLWVRAGRPWRPIGLAAPSGWRLIVGLGLMALAIGFTVQQIVAVRHVQGERLAKLRRQIADLEFMLPHTSREYRLFLALSCTAGVCEELLYRGYLTWLLAAFLGLPAAIVLVAVAFGSGHAYQGARGVLKTGLVSLVMSLIVVASGWLVPAMVVHALVDISGGTAGFTVLREEEAGAIAA